MIQQDRNKYEALRDTAYIKLRECSQDEEHYYRKLVNAYHDVFKSLETLDLILRNKG